MKLLNGADLAGFIKERHSRVMASLDYVPTLAIVCVEPNDATQRYLGVKRRYGDDIGVTVRVYEETKTSIADRVKRLNADVDTTGIIVQLPLPSPALTDEVLALIDARKDVDGLRPGSLFEPATPKAILWLLAGHNIDLKGRTIAVVGQGRLVGKPLADMLEASGHAVVRCDINTVDLTAHLIEADIIVAATGQAGLIDAAMLKDGAIVIDTGSPQSELSADVLDRTDLIRTPNPGGVGPMTVAALFDNLMIAATR